MKDLTLTRKSGKRNYIFKIDMKRWGFKDNFDDNSEEIVIDGVNLSQVLPNTLIFKKAKKIIIRKNNNLMNCKFPEGCEIITEGSANRAQVDFCSHNHPKLIEKGLSVCGGNCRHISLWGWVKGIFVERKYIDVNIGMP